MPAARSVRRWERPDRASERNGNQGSHTHSPQPVLSSVNETRQPIFIFYTFDCLKFGNANRRC